MLDGRFNDVLPWQYSRIPDILGAGKGFDVYTEGDLERGLVQAKANTESFSILDMHLDTNDRSEALHRLTSALRQRVK